MPSGPKGENSTPSAEGVIFLIFSMFFDPWGQPWGPLEDEGRPLGKLWEKWAQNGPFELSAGHREHQKRVRSINFIQFKPPKTPWDPIIG